MPTHKRLFGPLALTTTYTTNVYQGAGGSALVYDVLRHVSIVNKTAANASFRLYLGATGANAAGTEIAGFNTIIPPNGKFDWYGALRLDSTDFLVGGSADATSLTIMGEGERHVV